MCARSFELEGRKSNGWGDVRRERERTEKSMMHHPVVGIWFHFRSRKVKATRTLATEKKVHLQVRECFKSGAAEERQERKSEREKVRGWDENEDSISTERKCLRVGKLKRECLVKKKRRHVERRLYY